MMRKKIVSLCMALVLCLGLLPPATARAAEGETIHVGGKALTGSADIPAYAKTDSSSGTVTVEGSKDDYNIMWDGSTLTLNGATITRGSNQGAAISYYNNDPGNSGISQLTLELVGENTVTGPNLESSSVYDSYGIYVAGFGTSSDGTALTISGAGSLTATGGTVSKSGNYWSAGICNRVGEISVEGGTVNDAGDTDLGFGARLCIGWELLGGKPAPGEELRAHLRHHYKEEVKEGPVFALVEEAEGENSDYPGEWLRITLK